LFLPTGKTVFSNRQNGFVPPGKYNQHQQNN